MHQPPFEVADVIRTLAAADGHVPGLRVSQAQQRVLDDLATCRTAKLGGHVDACDACGEVRVVQLLPQSPLSEVPGAPPRHLARRSLPRSAASPLFPRRLHPARGAGAAGAAEPTRNLRSAVRYRRRYPQDHRGRPAASRLASSPCCTPGARPWGTIPISTASSRAVAYHPTLPTGFPAQRFLPPGPGPRAPVSRQAARSAAATTRDGRRGRRCWSSMMTTGFRFNSLSRW